MPLSIVHLINDVRPPSNGIINVTVDLACEQARAGRRVTVVSAGGGYVPLLQDEGVAHITLDQGRQLRNVAVLPRLARALRAVEPDLVHSHNVTGTVLARPWTRWAGRPLVATMHRESRESYLMAVADRIIVLNTAARHRLLQRRVPGSRVVLLRNGTVGGARREWNMVPHGEHRLDHPAVVTVAGLYRHKGVDVLLRAFAHVMRVLPAARLYVVGDGPEGERLRLLALRLGIADRVSFEGARPDAERYMAGADAFVLPSRVESSGLVIAEARAAGVPVIASAVGGIPEMLDGGQAGRLVPPDDPEALGSAVLAVLTDPAEQGRLRAAAAADLADLSVARLARDVDDVYLDVLRARSIRSTRSQSPR